MDAWDIDGRVELRDGWPESLVGLVEVNMMVEEAGTGLDIVEGVEGVLDRGECEEGRIIDCLRD